MTKNAQQHLLVCLVGGSPEPIVACMLHWQPARVLFLASSQTAVAVENKVLPLARASGLELTAGAYDLHEVSDAQDMTLCIETWRPLGEQVMQWLGRGDDYATVVDVTGGTKCMTAALAMLAHRWKCLFSYVGGSERTKDGVGIVVSGQEQICYAANPWNVLGRAAADDACLLFDRGLYTAAADHLDAAIRKISEPAPKRELATLKMLAEAYAAWDRFNHRKAVIDLENVRKNASDLVALFGHRAQRSLIERIGRDLAALGALDESAAKRNWTVADLLANSNRRAREGRHDDAVARIYRAVEALAQNQLSTVYNLDASRLPVIQLQGELQRKAGLARDDQTVALGLQDCYVLLRQLKDDLGERFAELGWDDQQRSPLMARNNSILAHGFEPVSVDTFRTLFAGALRLAGLKEVDLPQFPRLTSV